MPTNPGGDAADYLDANEATLTLGTNLFKGKMREKGGNIPTDAVFVLATGGTGPDGYADGTSVNLRYSGIQCMIRSSLNAFEAGETTARLVRDGLHHKPVSGYLDVRASESEPLYLGEAPEGFHLWSINFEMWHEE